MSEQTSNKRIAKNTILLYFRMLLTMIISLYTSRVVLKILGVDDFGIYETVGGVIGLFTFLQGALASGTSRFLAFEIGVGDEKKMKLNFSSIFLIHILLGVVIIALGETAGLWFVENKLSFASDRFDAAVFAYHMSVAAVVVSIVQIPYTASIMSHERMNIYAYFSILEVLLKLGIVYLLLISDADKLKFYSALILVVQVMIFSGYAIYCTIHYKESQLHRQYDLSIIKNVLSFSFWNLLTNVTLSLKNQGAVVLLSMFFNPAIVTGKAVASKVNFAANQFANNFRVASNPQIIKSYASGDNGQSQRLTLQTAKFSFFLMLILTVPILLTADSVLLLWLGQIPEYSVAFLQLALATSLINSMDNSFYTALCAVGRLKMNSILCTIVSIITIPIAYIFYKLGYGPVTIAWIILIDDFFISFVIKPYVMIREANFQLIDIVKVCFSCFVVTILSLPLPLYLHVLIENLSIDPIISDVIVGITGVLSTALAVWFVGLDSEMRVKLLSLTKSKISEYVKK